MRSIAVVGASGFIGGHLSSRFMNVRRFGRENITDLARDNSDLTIIAAAPATKWIANTKPGEDLANIKNLIESLRCIGTRRCVLISTIDVFPLGVKFSEDQEIPLHHPEAYGSNRGILETQLANNLENLHIIRLPGMFGPGLKKNLIFDLMYKKVVPRFHEESKFQFYDVRNLPAHIFLSLEYGLKITNLATEPITVNEIYQFCFDSQPPSSELPHTEYKMITNHSDKLAGRNDPYLLSKQEVLAGLRHWILSDAK